MAATAAAAGSQIVFVPGCTHACGLHQRARLMVVPLGARLPPGVTRLAASSPSTARTSRGRLHATALACVSTASTRPGALLRASTVGCASPYVPASGARSTHRAAEQAFLAPAPEPPSTRRFKTVAHVPATGTGAGDQAHVPKENDYPANVKDDGALARNSKDDNDGALARNSKDDNDGARACLMVVPLGARLQPGLTRLAASSPSTARSSRGHLHATALACVSTASARPSALLPASGARSTLRPAEQGFLALAPKRPSSLRSKTVAHVLATGAGDEADVPEESDYTANVKDDGALARTSKDGNDAARARAYKDDSGGIFRDVKNVADPKENNGSVDPKDNDGGADAKQNRGVFKDDLRIWMYADKKQSDLGFARFWRDVGSYPRSAERGEGTQQGLVDPSIILEEVDRFLLDYDPVDNMHGLSAVTHDEVILNEWKDAMCDANSLLHQAIWRGPLLAKHATELVVIGRAFGVVSKEAQLGFLQTRSMRKAIRGLKSMANVFLGQYTVYFPPADDSRAEVTGLKETVYFRMIGMDEKEYFWQLLHYYKAGFDCIRMAIDKLEGNG